MDKLEVKDRKERLEKGCCPIHGYLMHEIPPNELIYEGHLVECPIIGCGIQATEVTLYGKATLLPAFAHLTGLRLVKNDYPA